MEEIAQNPQVADDAAMVKEKKKNKQRKAIATTTYFLAMLVLLAGLFAPLYSWMPGTKIADRMMFKYLPAFINGVVGKGIWNTQPGGFLVSLSPDLLLNCNSLIEIRFISICCLLYVLVCVISVIMFIPVLLGSKKKNTSANCALGVEVLAMLVTFIYIAYETYIMSNNKIVGWTNYNFLLAFGGVLLMAIVQTIASKGGIGVSKVIGLILSVIGIIALLDITMFIPKLAEHFAKLSISLKVDGGATFVDGSLGVYFINALISIKTLFTGLRILPPAAAVVIIFSILVVLMTILNLIVDIIGLRTGKKYYKDKTPCANKGSNAFALTRYILTFILLAVIIALSFFKYAIVGLYAWLLLIVLFISIINAAARTGSDNARVKAYNKGGKEVQSAPAPAPVYVAPEPVKQSAPAPAPVYVAPQPVAPVAAEPEPEYVAPAPEPAYEYVPETAYEETPVVAEETYEEPAPIAEPLTAPLEAPEETEEGEENTRTVYIYGGATDDFMETLTDNEKVEFVELFLKKSKGTVNGVPDYQIDGDNSDFFPAIFVHINRYRNIVSDALMTKMYKQLGKV